ncbi:MAG: archaemetzincin family Zn-dependent metalloprotease [Vicinamibacteria bacterium]
MSRVVVAAVGDAPPAVLERMAAAVESAYGLPAGTGEALPEPRAAYSPQRAQWASAEYLKRLLAHPAAAEGRVLGVTERDLFVPVLSFVYGQAQLEGRVAVVSLARLRSEFHGLPPDAEALVRRAATEAVHEVGHTFGLVHCADRRCPMSLSIDLSDLDRKTAEPCPSCSALAEGSLEMKRARTRAEGGPR